MKNQDRQMELAALTVADIRLFRLFIKLPKGNGNYVDTPQKRVRRRWNPARLNRNGEESAELLSRLNVSTLRLCLEVGSEPSVFTGDYVGDAEIVDGMPRDSMAASPPLSHPIRVGALRSDPLDDLPRSKSHGFATSPTLSAILSRQCPVCQGNKTIRVGSREVKCQGCKGTGARDLSDPLGTVVDEMCAALEEIHRLAIEVDRRRQVLIHIRERRPRESSLQGNCAVTGCGKWVTGLGSDRLKRGWCPACFFQFTLWRLGNPPSSDPGADNRQFAAWRTAHIAAINAKDEVLQARLCEARDGKTSDQEWRIQAIDVMRKQGNLPKEREA